MGGRGSSSDSGKAYGISSAYVTKEIKKLAKEYKDDMITDGDVQDILEGFEFTRGENYENMNRYFNNLVSDIRTGKRKSKIAQARDELEQVQREYSQVAKALNYTNSETARAEFDRLTKRRDELMTLIGKQYE